MESMSQARAQHTASAITFAELTGVFSPTYNAQRVIKAITFDVDGTLWDFVSVMRSSLSQALLELERLDVEAAAMLDVDRMIEIRDRVHDEWMGKVLNLSVIRLESFRRALSDVGRPDDTLASHLCAVYFRHKNAKAESYVDVLPTLEALGQRYVVGVISNGGISLGELGLEGVVKFAVLAQDCGVEKPDPRIFQIALEKARCSPHELVHVGDSLESDVAGATNAGIGSVWLNRNGQPRDPGIKPDYEISTLRQLVGIL